MLNSLQSGCSKEPISADVAVIGAGLAGLVLANALASKGLKVIVLESGAERQVCEVHPDNKVEFEADNYGGASRGRVRALGGTSTRWGGALLPYLDYDFNQHPRDWHDGWGVDTAVLAPYLASIERDFGVMSGEYGGGDELTDLLRSFMPRLPKWPGFRNRATSNIYRDAIRSNCRLEIWTGAMVTEILLDINRVVGVRACNANGNSILVSAFNVAIAAGAIETTRLLLLLNRAHDLRLFPADGPLGKGFHDHLSAPVATLDAYNRSEISRLFSFRFVRGGMRNLRFELKGCARTEHSWPAAFVHVAFSREGENGFEALRDIYQALQRREIPDIRCYAAMLSDMPWFFEAVWWRFVEKRVLPPSQADFEMHLVTEQKPDIKNRISLSTTTKDQFGLPLANIEWRISEEDKLLFLQIADQAISDWEEGPLSTVAGIDPRDEQTIIGDLVRGGGIYHPAGSTRIGPGATSGVVDSNLRVHGVNGLWVVSTSVFPSVGGTSPSLGLMQLALRASDAIATSISRNV